MNLVIDVGNTRVKVALFEGDSLLTLDSFELKDIFIQLKDLEENNEIDKAIISSVANISDIDLKKIERLFQLVYLSQATEVPFINEYATKNTLGVDRMALASAAVLKYPNKNVLVIDAGSCITYDFISDKGVFKGGSISPGIEMRYRALNRFTDKLPLLNLVDEFPMIGNTTELAIHSGVLTGLIIEINGIIEEYNLRFEKLTVVLTGGDTIFLAKRLKNSIFANPNFLLVGLNNILIQNREND